MISFRVGSVRFHYRSAAIVLDAGHLLLHRLQGDEFWALPGGRVNPGETAEATIAREFKEELGAAVECKILACTGENFFEYDDEPHHELGLYFYATLPVDSPLLDKKQSHVGVEGDKLLEFKWFPVAEVADIDMRPSALRRGIAAGSLPTHFVQRD
jgi:8-oxo-dGTP pyrophosphatase MutT (NUDIX family)